MNETIFLTEFPFIDSADELEKIKKSYPNYDPYFIASGCIKERRKIFDKLWINYQSLADSHFVDQIKVSFHQRSWEMYMGNVLMEKKLEIESKNEGPDFIANNTAYIECVAPTKGDPKTDHAVPEMMVAKSPDEITVQNVPVDEIILRITQVIKDKSLDQYDGWTDKKWFNAEMPYVIAINTADLDYIDQFDMPYVIKALFGFSYMQIDTKTKQASYMNRDVIEKSKGVNVPVNYFVNSDFDFVSGVLFSDVNILNHPSKIGSECVFVNNPFAKNSVEDVFASLFNNWSARATSSGVDLKRNYK